MGKLKRFLGARAGRPIAIALAVSLGTAIGFGLYTFRYAKGLSYLKTDPKACANCHIMQRQYDGWQLASHHTAARCVDCHLPEKFFAKYYTKAENGYRHGKMFTLENFVEPIGLTKDAKTILLENCARCHADVTAEMAPGRGHQKASDCLHCHWTVGHGQRAALGGPLKQEEIERLVPRDSGKL
jgi:cytochrome c nitrite reductase small subunit